MDPIHELYASLTSAVDAMAEALSSDLMEDVWTSLSCAEVDSIAEVLRLAGHLEVAGSIIDQHAEGDEEGDLHFDGERCSCGRSLADGEGWDGRCGSCADAAEVEEGDEE